jgi:WD repeat-containing protein 48
MSAVGQGDNDYFTSAIGPVGGDKPVTPATPAPAPAPEPEKTPAVDANADKNKDKEKDKDKAADNGKSPGAFGKKFRMSFGTKKLGRSASQATAEKPAVVDEKAEESEESSSNHEKEVDDSFYGVVQKIRNEYEKSLAEAPDKFIETLVTPSLPIDTPVLKLPPTTKVIIQEETSGGSANIYQGTVATVGQDADLIEQKAPMWLGDLLLQNQVPFKEPVKVSFVLHPIGDLVGITAADGNNRLNANRMLRVKKILSYVAERIEAPEENPPENALKPDEYLELYCNDQVRTCPPRWRCSSTILTGSYSSLIQP